MAPSILVQKHFADTHLVPYMQCKESWRPIDFWSKDRVIAVSAEHFA